MAQAPAPELYPILTFAGLIAAGATGALVRSVIWRAEETATITSLVLGGVAGFVVGLAYLIPQWVALGREFAGTLGHPYSEANCPNPNIYPFLDS